MDTPDHSPLLLWAILDQTYTLLDKHLEKVMVQEGSSASMAGALFALKQAGRPISLSRLARLLVQEPQSITSLVDRLEKLGLMRRAPHERDRRAINVSLTPEGEALVEQLSVAAEQAFAAHFSVLEPKEVETFLRTLQTLRQHGAEVLQYRIVPFEDGAAPATERR